MKNIIYKYYPKQLIAAEIMLVIILPFIGLIYSYIHKNRSWFKNIFWFAIAYSGLIFIYNPIGGTENDVTRYAEEFQNISNLNLTFKMIIENLFTTGIFRDLFLPSLMHVLSFFSSDPKIFFFSFAIIFGFFYSRNIWFIFEKLPEKYNMYISILLLFYLLVLPPWGLVRIWLAIHVFVFGAMPYIFYNDKSKLIWLFVSVLIHYALIFPLLVFVFYSFIPRNVNLFFIFYLVTLFINEIDLNYVKELVLNTFPFMQSAVIAYTNETYAEIRRNMQYAWHVIWAAEMIKYVLISLTIITYFNIKKYHNENESLIRLFSFSLLIYGASNIFALVPSGGRFIYLSQLFILPSIILSFLKMNQDSMVQRFLPLSLFLVFPIIFQIRIGFDYYGISLFVGNVFSALIWNDNIPLIDFVK